MPFGEPPNGKEARLRAGPRGGVPPLHPSSAPSGAGGGAGREQRADAGRAGLVELEAASG